MSKFLGPIHYWLYGKIGHQEELTKAIAEYAQSVGWINNAAHYEKALPPLETVIDEGNIHGWLQSQISDAETRYADLICAILSADKARLDILQTAAFDFGKRNALEEGADAEAAYHAFENFFVNGMPCDRVNTVTAKDADSVSWEMTQDIHAQYWTACAEGSAPYYALRKRVMDGMLSRTALRLSMEDATHYSIIKES